MNRDEAWLLIAYERQHVVNVQGRTGDLDDVENSNGELVSAALCYYSHARLLPGFEFDIPSRLWPWSPTLWQPSDRLSDLVKAGGFCMAELERRSRGKILANKAVIHLLDLIVRALTGELQ